MSQSGFNRRNYYNLNRNAPFQTQPVKSNATPSNRSGAQKPHYRSGGHHDRGFQKHSHYGRIHAPPTNHSWVEEFRAAQISEDYESEGVVVWVEGLYGEVICEKNINNSYAHFYFDGTTEIDGQIVAVAQREGTFELQAGSKIEFECRYLQPVEKKQLHTVHIKKITLLKKNSKVEPMEVCIVTSPEDPHANKWSINDSGDYVLLSPLIFSKNWIIQSLEARSNGTLPDFIEPDRVLYKVGRTLEGLVMKSPRWMLDGGDHGEMGKNPRKFLLNAKPCPMISGLATIDHIVPYQSAILIADGRPDEPMYWPIVAFPLEIKLQVVKGARVEFVASKELPKMTYFWRVNEVVFTDAKPRPKATSIYARHLSKKELVNATKNSIIKAKRAREIEEQELTNKFRTSVVEDISPSGGGGEKTMEVEKEEEMKVEEESKDISEEEENPRMIRDKMCEMLGCSPYDVDGDEVERVQAHHELAVEYNHHVMTMADRVAAEQKRQRREDYEYGELSEEKKTELEREVRGHFGLPLEKPKNLVEDVDTKNNSKKKNEVGAEIFAPLEGFNVIGLYDDVKLCFDRILLENEEQKRLDKVKEEREKLGKRPEALAALEGSSKPKEVWWFRRKTPRLCPTFIMAELCDNRTEEEICQEYNVDLLTETVVLRRDSKFIQEKPVPAVKVAEENEVETGESSAVESSENVEPIEIIEPVEIVEQVVKKEFQQPEGFISPFFKDDIVAKFIRTLKSR